MDMTAYWLNFKKKRTGEGKYYYFYPYTRCEIDDTPTIIIDGKLYVRIEVSEKEREILRKKDDEEYNDERSAHNKRWTADIPRLQNEDGEEIDFWTDRAEDKRTHYIEDDICEEIDRREAEKALPPLERYIYRADREGFTQSEIAKKTDIDQSTVSRKLDRLYDLMNFVRLYDGERTKKELVFEVGWESFLRNRFMKNDADLWAVTFQILAGEKFLSMLHKWYYSPRELLRYSIRFLIIGGKETREELLAQVSDPAKEFFYQRFRDEPKAMQKLCLRVILELERRVMVMPEPTGNVFHGMERAIEKLAHRRKMPYDFYLDEILSRKYSLHRIRWELSYAQRIAAKTRKKEIRTAMQQVIASLERDQKKLQRDLLNAIQAHIDSLPLEIAAKIYKKTIKQTSKKVLRTKI